MGASDEDTKLGAGVGHRASAAMAHSRESLDDEVRKLGLDLAWAAAIRSHLADLESLAAPTSIHLGMTAMALQTQSSLPSAETTVGYQAEFARIVSNQSFGRDPENAHRQLSALRVRVDTLIQQLNGLFGGLLASTRSRVQHARTLSAELRTGRLAGEAQTQVVVINGLVQDLAAIVDGQEVYILSSGAQKALGLMTEVEKRRHVLEQLVLQSEVDATAFQVSMYTLGAIAALVLAVGIAAFLQMGEVSLAKGGLSTQRLPILGVPWPVVVWSLVGSLASTVYYFNRHPTYEFNDVLKWMITRPVQGVVLGSAMYFVLASGFFVLSGGASDAGSIVDSAVLVLVFLVGFSDRFTESVFSTLVRQYGDRAETPASGKTGATTSRPERTRSVGSARSNTPDSVQSTRATNNSTDDQAPG